MAASYVDESMALRLEGLLRSRGHLVSSTYGEGRLGAPDPHQLLFAAQRGWVLVTHNRRDYRLLHHAWHHWSYAWGTTQRHARVLAHDQVPGQPVEELAALIHGLVVDPDVSLPNALFDWRRATGWRRFPA
jgi:Domain of unknown function (DUF5615)